MLGRELIEAIQEAGVEDCEIVVFAHNDSAFSEIVTINNQIDDSGDTVGVISINEVWRNECVNAE